MDGTRASTWDQGSMTDDEARSIHAFFSSRKDEIRRYFTDDEGRRLIAILDAQSGNPRVFAESVIRHMGLPNAATTLDMLEGSADDLVEVTSALSGGVENLPASARDIPVNPARDERPDEPGPADVNARSFAPINTGGNQGIGNSDDPAVNPDHAAHALNPGGQLGNPADPQNAGVLGVINRGGLNNVTPKADKGVSDQMFEGVGPGGTPGAGLSIDGTADGDADQGAGSKGKGKGKGKDKTLYQGGEVPEFITQSPEPLPERPWRDILMDYRPDAEVLADMKPEDVQRLAQQCMQARWRDVAEFIDPGEFGNWNPQDKAYLFYCIAQSQYYLTYYEYFKPLAKLGKYKKDPFLHDDKSWQSIFLGLEKDRHTADFEVAVASCVPQVSPPRDQAGNVDFTLFNFDNVNEETRFAVFECSMVQVIERFDKRKLEAKKAKGTKLKPAEEKRLKELTAKYPTEALAPALFAQAGADGDADDQARPLIYPGRKPIPGQKKKKQDISVQRQDHIRHLSIAVLSGLAVNPVLPEPMQNQAKKYLFKEAHRDLVENRGQPTIDFLQVLAVHDPSLRKVAQGLMNQQEELKKIKEEPDKKKRREKLAKWEKKQRELLTEADQAIAEFFTDHPDLIPEDDPKRLAYVQSRAETAEFYRQWLDSGAAEDGLKVSREELADPDKKLNYVEADTVWGHQGLRRVYKGGLSMFVSDDGLVIERAGVVNKKILNYFKKAGLLTDEESDGMLENDSTRGTTYVEILLLSSAEDPDERQVMKRHLKTKRLLGNHLFYFDIKDKYGSGGKLLERVKEDSDLMTRTTIKSDNTIVIENLDQPTKCQPWKKQEGILTDADSQENETPPPPNPGDRQQANGCPLPETVEKKGKTDTKGKVFKLLRVTNRHGQVWVMEHNRPVRHPAEGVTAYAGEGWETAYYSISHKGMGVDIDPNGDGQMDYPQDKWDVPEPEAYNATLDQRIGAVARELGWDENKKTALKEFLYHKAQYARQIHIDTSGFIEVGVANFMNPTSWNEVYLPTLVYKAQFLKHDQETGPNAWEKMDEVLEIRQFEKRQVERRVPINETTSNVYQDYQDFPDDDYSYYDEKQKKTVHARYSHYEFNGHGEYGYIQEGTMNNSEKLEGFKRITTCSVYAESYKECKSREGSWTIKKYPKWWQEALSDIGEVPVLKQVIEVGKSAVNGTIGLLEHAAADSLDQIGLDQQADYMRSLAYSAWSDVGVSIPFTDISTKEEEIALDFAREYNDKAWGQGDAALGAQDYHLEAVNWKGDHRIYRQVFGNQGQGAEMQRAFMKGEYSPAGMRQQLISGEFGWGGRVLGVWGEVGNMFIESAVMPGAVPLGAKLLERGAVEFTLWTGAKLGTGLRVGRAVAGATHGLMIGSMAVPLGFQLGDTIYTCATGGDCTTAVTAMAATGLGTWASIGTTYMKGGGLEIINQRLGGWTSRSVARAALKKGNVDPASPKGRLLTDIADTGTVPTYLKPFIENLPPKQARRYQDPQKLAEDIYLGKFEITPEMGQARQSYREATEGINALKPDIRQQYVKAHYRQNGKNVAEVFVDAGSEADAVISFLQSEGYEVIRVKKVRGAAADGSTDQAAGEDAVTPRLEPEGFSEDFYRQAAEANVEVIYSFERQAFILKVPEGQRGHWAKLAKEHGVEVIFEGKPETTGAVTKVSGPGNKSPPKKKGTQSDDATIELTDEDITFLDEPSPWPENTVKPKGQKVRDNSFLDRADFIQELETNYGNVHEVVRMAELGGAQGKNGTVVLRGRRNPKSKAQNDLVKKFNEHGFKVEFDNVGETPLLAERTDVAEAPAPADDAANGQGTKVIKKKPNKQDAQADQTPETPIEFEGPDPYMGGPTTEVLGKASHKARTKPRELTNAEAEAIIEQAILEDRRALLEKQNVSDLGACSVQGACGLSQADVVRRLQHYAVDALEVYHHQAANLFGSDSFRHAFIVVRVKSTGKIYLVDATARQFFQKGKQNTNQIGYAGDIMRNMSGGNVIADRLIKYGYIELTPEVANVYGRGLSGSPRGPPITRETYLKEPTQPLKDYDADDLNDFMGPLEPIPEAGKQQAQTGEQDTKK
ncbi:MAG: hypothetical protein HYT79_03725 [Elusimicrobia bacterium]|nr:hypothetical protein [Elusimicrobiota bacterium]